MKVRYLGKLPILATWLHEWEIHLGWAKPLSLVIVPTAKGWHSVVGAVGVVKVRGGVAEAPADMGGI
jgi:hypothetical protein